MPDNNQCLAVHTVISKVNAGELAWKGSAPATSQRMVTRAWFDQYVANNGVVADGKLMTWGEMEASRVLEVPTPLLDSAQDASICVGGVPEYRVVISVTKVMEQATTVLEYREAGQIDWLYAGSLGPGVSAGTAPLSIREGTGDVYVELRIYNHYQGVMSEFTSPVSRFLAYPCTGSGDPGDPGGPDDPPIMT